MNHLKKISTKIEGVFVYQRTPIVDSRGFFERFFCEEELKMFGFDKSISQINFSCTRKKGIVRGMHMQREPSLESKIVSCVRGEVFDVAVDLRQNSPTYLQYHSEILDENNRKSLVIPEGCAHGFQALSDQCELLYLHSVAYDSEAEYGVNALDEALNIAWPMMITERSERDQCLPYIK